MLASGQPLALTNSLVSLRSCSAVAGVPVVDHHEVADAAGLEDLVDGARRRVEAQRLGLDRHDDLVGHVEHRAQRVGGGAPAQRVGPVVAGVEVDPAGGVDVDVLDAGQVLQPRQAGQVVVGLHDVEGQVVDARRPPDRGALRVDGDRGDR